MQLAQGDFSSLGIEQEPGTQMIDEIYKSAPVERAGSGDSLKSQATFEDEINRPDQLFSYDDDELIRNSVTAYIDRRDSSHAIDSMKTQSSDLQSRESVFEPMRFVSVPEIPPKRFFRTFWRSVTWRILQLNEKNAANTDISSSNPSDDGSNQSALRQ